ncbi:MAG: hypothetical protein ABH829_01340 [archaeon]
MYLRINSVSNEIRFKESILKNFNYWLKHNNKFAEFFNPAKCHPLTLDLKLVKLVTFVSRDLNIPISWSWYKYGPAVVRTSKISVESLLTLGSSKEFIKDMGPSFETNYSEFIKYPDIFSYLNFVYSEKDENEMYLSKLQLFNAFDTAKSNIYGSKKIEYDTISDLTSQFHLDLHSTVVPDDVCNDFELQNLIVDYTTIMEELILKNQFEPKNTDSYSALLDRTYNALWDNGWEAYASKMSMNTMRSFSDEQKQYLIDEEFSYYPLKLKYASDLLGHLKQDIAKENLSLDASEREQLMT